MKNGISATTNTERQSSERAEFERKRQAAKECIRNASFQPDGTFAPSFEQTKKPTRQKKAKQAAEPKFEIPERVRTETKTPEKTEREKKRRAALERLKAELQCDEIQDQSWMEPREGIDCLICNNAGTFVLIRDGKACSRTCSCRQARDSIKRIRDLGLTKQAEECTFEKYLTPQAWQKQAKQIALQFVENKDRQWLLLAGQSGAGKTHLAVATAVKLLRQGLPMYYMRWIQDAPKLKAQINDAESYEKLIQPLRKYKVLYIDDFWKCKRGQAEPSDADVRLAYDILDYRYNNDGLITIISTEWTMEQLINLDEAVGGRIFEKTKDARIVLEGRDKNWRIYGDK